MKSSDLAAALRTTTGFVPQVVGPLVKSGWVRSEPGPTGGYVLTQPLESLNVLDVIEAVDGVTDDGRCVVADRACGEDSDTCALHNAWSVARKRLTDSLRHTPLTEVQPDYHPLTATPT